MAQSPLGLILAQAQARRDQGDWEGALTLFRRAEALAPGAADVKHNLAMISFAMGDMRAAKRLAGEAITIAPKLWQSAALLARLHRAAGETGRAEAAWESVLATDPGNGIALLGLADLALNAYADPTAAVAHVAPLHNDPNFAADAKLTTLMADLYLGTDPRSLSTRLIRFSRANLRLPLRPPRILKSGRRRVGLISPLFSASPVYFLTWSTWQAVAVEHDLVVINRGSRRDWATDRFADLSAEWIDAVSLDAPLLARRLGEADLDILFDLGGWTDVVGLQALSSRPAGRMFSWIGGQSATTGLDMFDGWIGDEWQSPQAFQQLYAEPLLNIAGGYCDYTPPADLAALQDRPKSGVALVGNPAKFGEAMLVDWPDNLKRVKLIDRRYIHSRTLARVTDLLQRGGIEIEAVIVPQSHRDYLEAVSGCSAILNSQPYSAGLTAVEALALGVELLAPQPAGKLFCSRHHLSHSRTNGRNRALAPQIMHCIVN